MMFGFNSKKKGYGFGPMPGFSNKHKSTIARGNWDRDRKPNRGDCDPFNWRKQDGGEQFVDKTGYYTGYCQCNCEKCRKGEEHCQGLVCKGD